MKRLLLLLVFVSSWCHALNGPTISTANLPRIEAGLKFAQANNIEWVRMNIGMAEATKGSTLDTYAAQRVGELCKQYGRKVVLVDYTQAPNTKYWRLQSGLDDAELWNKWKADEQLGLYQDCHNRNGLYPWLEPIAIQTSERLVAAFATGYGKQPDIRQLENEIGLTIDSRIVSGDVYGSVPQSIRAYLSRRVSSITDGVPVPVPGLASPAHETQTLEGLLNQIAAEDKSYWNRFSYQSLNWYMTSWQSTDTPYKWAKRAIAEIEAFATNVWWPGRPLLISEIAAIGCPVDKRLACYQSFLRYKPASWIACWWSYDDEGWAVQ